MTKSPLSQATGPRLLRMTCAGALSLLMAATTHAAGHGPGERFPINLSELETRAQERFASVDTNASNSIELDEFLAAEGPRHPRRGHAQKRMRKQHMAPRHHGRGQVHDRDPQLAEEMRGLVKDQTFSLLDTDGDGNVSAEEFDSADHRAIRHEARKRAMFAHLDADDSGSLSVGEMPSRLERLRGMDTDGDGQVTRQEFRAARRDSSA